MAGMVVVVDVVVVVVVVEVVVLLGPVPMHASPLRTFRHIICAKFISHVANFQGWGCSFYNDEFFASAFLGNAGTWPSIMFHNLRSTGTYILF